MNRPKHEQIFTELSEDVLSGRYQAGHKLPSEANLVKRFGASRITVRRALADLKQRGLIERVAGSGSYVRNTFASRREGLVLGLIIPHLGETEIFEPICQAIAGSPDSSGHALLWPHASTAPSDRDDLALQLCRHCLERKVSGVFFAPLEMTPREHETNLKVSRLLHDAGIPVVLLDRRSDAAGARFDLVGIDNHRAGYLATAHLAKLGARRISFLALQGQAATVETRIAGYLQALHEATLESSVIRISSTQPLNAADGLPPCDGFVCANDRIAGRLMHALLARGVSIPRDVRVVGIDDVNYAALLPVPLTTIHQPCRDIGEVALRVMLERLDRPKMPAREVLLDCELVIRQSCGSRF